MALQTLCFANKGIEYKMFFDIWGTKVSIPHPFDMDIMLLFNAEYVIHSKALKNCIKGAV